MQRLFTGTLAALAAVALAGCAGSSRLAPSIGQSQQQNADGVLGATRPTITEFSHGLPGDHSPFFITRGPDGNMWFTDYIDPDFGTNLIGRITPDGTVTKFPYLNYSQLTFPIFEGIALGSDGNLWISDAGDGVISRMTQTGKIKSFTLPSPANPQDITNGPDNQLWVVDAANNTVDKMTTDGVLTIYSSGITANAYLRGITSGPDGNLWFTENFGNKVASITTGGTVVEHSMGISANAKLNAITAGPDHALWFTEDRAIGRITTAGVVTEYRNGISPGEHPVWIALGADGALWFTEHGNRAMLGRITTKGTITEYSAGITNGSYPGGIAPGMGRTMWFTESNAHRVARAAF